MSDNRGRPTKQVETVKDIFLTNCNHVSQILGDNEFTARQIAEIEYAAVAVLSYVVGAKRKADSHYIQEYLERLAGQDQEHLEGQPEQDEL